MIPLTELPALFMTEPGFDINMERHIYKTADPADLPEPNLIPPEYIAMAHSELVNYPAIMQWLDFVKIDGNKYNIGVDPSIDEVIFPTDKWHIYSVPFSFKWGRPLSSFYAYSVVKLLKGGGKDGV